MGRDVAGGVAVAPGGASIRDTIQRAYESPRTMERIVSRLPRRRIPVRHFVVLALLTPFLVWPINAEAQQGSESCDYDTCALRLAREGWLFSRTKVVQGVEGREVARYGRSPVLEELFAADETAGAHYADFTRHDRRATVLDRLGLTLALAGVVVEISSGWERTEWSSGLLLGGAVMGIASSRPHHQAREAFSLAVWWYNRSLTEAGEVVPQPPGG